MMVLYMYLLHSYCSNIVVIVFTMFIFLCIFIIHFFFKYFLEINQNFLYNEKKAYYVYCKKKFYIILLFFLKTITDTFYSFFNLSLECF